MEGRKTIQGAAPSGCRLQRRILTFSLRYAVTGRAGLSALLAAAVSSPLIAGQISISVSATPELPVRNIIANGAFEEGLTGWRVDATRGTTVPDKETKYSGAGSLRLESHAKERFVGAYVTQVFDCAKLVSDFGTDEFVVGCRVKAGPKIRKTPNAGTGILGIACSKDRKRDLKLIRDLRRGEDRWNHQVSKAVKIEEWMHSITVMPGIFYNAGTAWFDEIVFVPAYARFHIAVSSPRAILQVIIEDEKGNIVHNSGALAEGTKKYEKTTSVLTPHQYVVKAVDEDGNIGFRKYPESLE